MFQGKGQTIVYSSQLDDGLLHHHPVAVLEGSGTCHKDTLPEGTIPLPLSASSNPAAWIFTLRSSLSPVLSPFVHRKTLLQVGGRQSCSLPRPHPKNAQVQQHQFPPHRAQMCSQRSPIRPHTTNTEGRETIQRPRRWDQTSARWETQASWEIPIPPARSRAPCRAPVWEEPLTRTPALSRGQSYLMSQLSLPRSAGR